MKRLLTVAILIGATSFALAQGTVNFSAGGTAATRIATNTVAAGPSTGYISGSTYYFALFVAPSTVTVAATDPTLSGFTFTGYYGTNGTALGRFTGNPTTDDVAIAGYATGASASFVVLGWSANVNGNGAPDWTTARGWINGSTPATQPFFFGESGVATSVGLGGGLSFAGNIFGAQAGQATGFTLGLQVPEPTTVALCGLGAAAMLIFRRRK